MGELSPSFQFFPRDFLSDEQVARMGNAETGIYIRLLAFCWLEGSITADLEDLALMLPRTSTKDLDRAWKIVGRCFTPHPTEAGRLVQKRIEKERENQRVRRAARAAAGKKGGEQKRDNATAEPEREPSKNLALLESATSKTVAEASLSSATASANTDTVVSVPGGALPRPPRPRKPRQEPLLDEPWMLELRQALVEIKDLELRTLDPDQVFVVAYYHGLHWAYLRTVGRNKSGAGAIATSLTNLVDRIKRSPNLATITVAEYVGYARKHHERIGRKPWFRPFDILAEVEIENAA